MKKAVFLFGLLGFFLFNVHIAHAEKRIIEIRQLDPDGETQATICPDKLKTECYLTIKAVSKTTLKTTNIAVYVSSYPGWIGVNFKADGQSVAVELLHMDIGDTGRSIRTVQLYWPHGENVDKGTDDGMVHGMPVKEPYINLEIKVLPSQN